MRWALRSLRRSHNLDNILVTLPTWQASSSKVSKSPVRPCAATFGSVAGRRTAPRGTQQKVKDLPQGLLSRDPEGTEGKKEQTEEDEDEARFKQVTLVEQVRDNIRKFPNCVVITRVGGFYELYFDQAEEYASKLGIKLTAKRVGKESLSGPVPMAGFPVVHLDKYLKILVDDLKCYVAISEEFRLSKMEQSRTGRLFDRKVDRIVTPGTLVDEKFMDPQANNFCLALYPDPGKDAVKEDVGSDGGLSAGNMALSKLRLADTAVGLAWLDVSTGEFFLQRSSFAGLPSLLARISPKEIVLNDELPAMQCEVLDDILDPGSQLITRQPVTDSCLTTESWQDMMDSPIPEITWAKLAAEEMKAGSMILQYVGERFPNRKTKFQPPALRVEAENMAIDRHTLRGLEVLETLRGASFVGAKGSLLHAIKRTVTESGARLLRDRVTRPSAVMTTINDRLDMVEELVHRTEMKTRLTDALRRTFDTQRLVQRLALGRGDIDDLLSLSLTINLNKTISDTLKEDGTAQALAKLEARFSLERPVELRDRIVQAIDENALLTFHEKEDVESSVIIEAAQRVLGSEGSLGDIQAFGAVARAKTLTAAKDSTEKAPEDTWIMRKEASDDLRKLHELLEGLENDKSELHTRMRKEINSDTLLLRWTAQMGHHCYVRRIADVRRSEEKYPATRGESTAKRPYRSFYVPEWTGLGNRIDTLKIQIREEEQKVFNSLRGDVVKNLVLLRRNASILDELDVACSSASLAIEQNAVRPSLDEGSSLVVVGGRHPTVTLGVEEKGRKFVENDCFMNTIDRKTPAPMDRLSSPAKGGELIHLITGPNMAGKSTFLRQNALFAIMAQVGLFVPASFAHIGIVDALFARIGSADNLFSDQSTFMTEMLETAAILGEATPRSLVIMDEVGRGTTPEDGLAVAFAALWHLKEVNQSRSLFATHFHALADMTADWDSQLLGRYCTDVRETKNGGFVYRHKIEAGVNRNSHALKVASMAGLPRKAIEVAQGVLDDGLKQV